MKLVFIRHGDPDYVHDSLTEKGFREAQLLTARTEEIGGDYYYVSPLGRAKATAAPFLEKVGREAVEFDWLQEFRGSCIRPDSDGRLTYCWDWLPEDLAKEPGFTDREKWLEVSAYKETNITQEFEYVTSSFDALLAEHGYRRKGDFYEVLQPNHDTLVFFCHFAVTCVMVGHMLNISPAILWHSAMSAPTSVTVLCSEERRKGTALFRMSRFGDISHLYAAGEEPAFAGRFCECFSDDTRH